MTPKVFRVGINQLAIAMIFCVVFVTNQPIQVIWAVTIFAIIHGEYFSYVVRKAEEHDRALDV